VATVSGCSVRKKTVNLATFKKKYPRVKIYTDAVKMFEDKTIEAIVIATPPETHYMLARQALEHGKHVFVEKPMALKVSEVEKLIALSKKNNRVLFSGYTFLYYSLTKKIKSILEDDPALTVLFSWNKFGSFKTSGIINLMCHDIALASEWFGNLSKNSLVGSLDIKGKDDIALATSTSHRTHISFLINRLHCESAKEVLLQCKKHTYVWAENSLFKQKKNGTWSVVAREKNKNPLRDECGDFIQKVCAQKYWVRNSGTCDISVAKFFEVIL
jgi:predicted dehydrogenase